LLKANYGFIFPPVFQGIFLFISCPVEGTQLLQGCIEIKGLPRFASNTPVLAFKTAAQYTWLFHSFVLQYLDGK
jgi:hypothetical protein